MKHKIAMTFLSITALSIVVATATGGYLVGNYVATERAQKKALAFQCGSIDRRTTAFSWTLPSCVIANEKAAESVSRGKGVLPPVFSPAR